MGLFDHVRPGDPLPTRAPTLNAMLDAARAGARGHLGLRGRRASPPADRAEVLIRNDTGAALAQFAVVGPGAPIIDPAESERGFRRRVALAGEVPGAEDRGRFAVLLEPAAAGKIAAAILAGPCHARLYVPAGTETRRRADVVAGVTAYLRPALTGAEILWRQDGTSADPSDLKWAVVRLGAGAGAGTVWAEITGGDQATGFTWEQRVGTDAHGWSAPPDPLNSTDDGRAYLANDVVVAAGLVGLVVRLHRVDTPGGTDWRFEAPLPPPVTQYKGLHVDGDGRWHEDWTRAHG